MAGEARIGTSGFAYREWTGSVYPRVATSGQLLKFYAQRLHAVEIASTQQVPQSMKCDRQALALFLGSLPGGLRIAFEFQHPSWQNDSTLRVLSRHDAALVITDHGVGVPLLQLTAGFTYVRIRRDDDNPEIVDDWAERLGLLTRRGIDVYAFLKHDRRGVAVDRAARLASLLRTESEIGEQAMLS